jgi:NTE family protein
MKIKSFFLISVIIMMTSCASQPKILYNIPETPPPARKIENVNVALVLGGGGSRGIAHLGVIKVLEEHKIPIDLIVGTSAGSVVGAMYADYVDHDLLYQQLINLRKWDLLDISLGNSLTFFTDIKGPVGGCYLEQFLVTNMTTHNIEDLKIPFVAVATDIEKERAYLFESGPIALGVHASSAIPPIFSPVRAYGKILVDGGIIEAVPVRVAKKYNPKIIIAVDISTNGVGLSPVSMADVVSKSMTISYYTMSRMQSAGADVVIHPNLHEYGTFDDHANQIMYERGKNAALKKLPDILRRLRANGL